MKQPVKMKIRKEASAEASPATGAATRKDRPQTVFPKHPWTALDVEILRRERVPGKNNEWLAGRLGRSVSSVKSKAGWLGLTKTSGFKHWTAQENERLVELVGRISPKKVAKRMGRSVTAVRSRAGRMGLSWRNRNDWYTEFEVSEILGFGPHWVGKRIHEGTLKASFEHDREPGKSSPYPWRIERDDLRAFLRRYPHELIGRNLDIVQIVEILAGLDYEDPEERGERAMREPAPYRLDIIEIESADDVNQLGNIAEERRMPVRRWTLTENAKTLPEEPEGETHLWRTESSLDECRKAALEELDRTTAGQPGRTMQAAVRNPLDPDSGRTGRGLEVIILVRRAGEPDIRTVVRELEDDENRAALMIGLEWEYQQMIALNR